MSVSIQTIAEAIGAPDAAKDWADNLIRWAAIYSCKPVERVVTLRDGAHKRRIRSLSMGKRIAEDWAGLCWTENATVEVDGADGVLAEMLDEMYGDRFAPGFVDFLERVFAQGLGGTEVLIHGMKLSPNGAVAFDGASIELAHADAQCIIPLAWTPREITSAAFVSFPSKTRVDVRIHSDGPGVKVITNRSFNVRGAKLVEMRQDELIAEGTAPVVTIQSPFRLFSVLKPAIANNIDATSPYGVPVFANAEDHLATLDLMFDNMAEDFELGGKIVGVPEFMLRRDANDQVIPPQRDKKNLFVALEGAAGVAGGATQIWEHNPDLRVEDNKAGIDAMLSLLSSAVGMGSERYVYRGETIATATQIISENSDLFRSRRKHMLSVTAHLTDITRAVLWLASNLLGMTANPDAEVVIRSDDSVIEDDNSRIARGLTLVQNNVISKRTFLVDYMGMTEEDADTEVGRLTVAVPALF